ncbi:helix-turn-helix domain-containing protein [Shimazuella sp. AN120528]|uniref:bifunctional transcriptional activator/DNA repair enzyme AdaA n=1 Tax=Shimazuella soli TaxID=1892854 RepID=UPI001F0E2FCB|nr:Ada metal-binding domain-containing protein [Shimazuella soli]MCH5585548.1 helix-turn-helix domain-containing protein [Shimazuella soli]
MNQAIFESVYNTVVQKNTKYDGIYYTGIKTTRIVCRPSCKSRTPKKENVLLFQSVEDAIKAGFRPCKRCRPEQIGTLGPDACIAYDVKQIILEFYAESVTLEYLSKKMVISPYHLQRVFKRVTGITPAKFLQETRIKKAKQLLQKSNFSMIEISRLVGFQSPSHFSMIFKRYANMSPNHFREFAKKEGESVAF